MKFDLSMLLRQHNTIQLYIPTIRNTKKEGFSVAQP